MNIQKLNYGLSHWFNDNNEIELIPHAWVVNAKPNNFKTEEIFPNLNYTFYQSLALNKDYL
jgi:hypothetical protein